MKADSDGAKNDGVQISDLLSLSDAERQLMLHIVRVKRITLEQAAEAMALAPEDARSQLEALADQGFLQCDEDSETCHIHYRRKPLRHIPDNLWSKLNH